MRTPFLAANWKMFKTVARGGRLRARSSASSSKDVTASRSSSRRRSRRCTPWPSALRDTQRRRRRRRTCYWEKEGAFTGEVSAAMIKEAGAEYVIVGHSERRRLFGETDAVGEPEGARGARQRPHPDRLHRRDARGARGRTRRSTCSIARSKDGLDGSRPTRWPRSCVAYEPVWAIGTGRNATPQQAGEAHAHIRGAAAPVVRRRRRRQACRILYGGSVKPDNVAELRAQPDVDGALVGGASLDPQTFAEIVTRGLGKR